MENNKGFALVEGILIFLILAILCGTGWYVWNARSKTNDSLASAATSSVAIYSKPKPKPVTDPTADWVTYSSKEGQYSLKYPKSWITAGNPEQCTPGILLLGADSKSVGSCGSGYFGQISIVSVQGDSLKDSELKAATSGSGNLGYKDIMSSTVDIDNAKGEKQTATASGEDTQGPTGLPKDTRVTKYIIYANSRTYLATYVSGDYQGKAYSDALSDFELMVTKTFKFSS